VQYKLDDCKKFVKGTIIIRHCITSSKLLHFISLNIHHTAKCFKWNLQTLIRNIVFHVLIIYTLSFF